MLFCEIYILWVCFKKNKNPKAVTKKNIYGVICANAKVPYQIQGTLRLAVIKFTVLYFPEFFYQITDVILSQSVTHRHTQPNGYINELKIYISKPILWYL